MSDENERSVASAGSIAAWAVMDGLKTLVGYHSCSRDKAEAWAKEYGFPEVVPLYAAAPQDRVVRLPRWIASGTEGYDQITAALDAAGVKWEIVNNCQ